MGKIIFCLNQPNRLKRMMNRFFVEKNKNKTQKTTKIISGQKSYQDPVTDPKGGQPYNPCGFVTDR